MNIPFILETVRKIGDEYLATFRKQSIPTSMDVFMDRFNDIEPKVLAALKERIVPLYPDIQWADGGEFDFEEQKAPLPVKEYWVCDSMDGAIQYIQHLPGWTINLVLVRDGRPYFSVIYDAMQNEMFWAEEGKGAYLNDQPIKVNKKTDTEFLLTNFNHPSITDENRYISERVGKSVEKLLSRFGAVRNYGPLGLQIASVGAGRIDVFYQEGLDTYNWLPGLLIAKEAGAELSTGDGRPWNWGEDSVFVAAPGVITEFLSGS
jgi:myo-inositol-1(or 4)-monophosphatase